MNDFTKIVDCFDIHEGETVFISSDMHRFIVNGIRCGIEFNPNSLIDAIIHKIGPNGTLLFPTYNWDYCQGLTFDYNTTPCKTGLLGETALHRTDFKRTQHPIYSFAVWGADQDYLCNLNNIHSFGSDSPFAYLKNKNARNVLIDIDYLKCFTYVHFVEEQTDSISYRYQKMFHAQYIDRDGVKSDRDYSMLVRDLDLDVRMVTNNIGQILENKGISIKKKIDSFSIITLKMGDAYPIIEEDILNNKSRNICTYIGQER